MFPHDPTRSTASGRPPTDVRTTLRTLIGGIACLAIATIAIVPAGVCAEPVDAPRYAPGYLTTELTAEHRPGAVPLSVWYPAHEDGVAEFVGRNPLFPGERVQRDATPAAGEHPLIVLSHGAGGLPEGLAWFGVAMARHGVVVAAPKHPGSSFGDYDFARVLDLADRRADLGAVLDVLLAGELPIGTVRARNITAVGFSMGGHSVLSMAGARAILSRYQAYCDGTAHMDCAWWRQNSLDLGAVSRAQFESAARDPRLTRVVAIDPGIAAAFDNESLTNLALPTLLINLGDAEVIFAGIDGAPLAEHIPDARYLRIPGATHFSFLGICVENAEAMLREEGEAEPLCTDGEGGDRRVIHDSLRQAILAFIRSTD